MSDSPRTPTPETLRWWETVVREKGGCGAVSPDHQRMCILEPEHGGPHGWEHDSPRTPEAVARQFHETYERLAPEYGYETREESAVPWEDVPEANRALMVAVVAEVLAALVALAERQREALRELRESLRIEPYRGVKYKLLCHRCEGLGEVGPSNHDDPKSWPCSECEGLGVRPKVLAAIRKADAVLAVWGGR